MWTRLTVAVFVVLSWIQTAYCLDTGAGITSDIAEPFLGDFPEMKKRGIIRVLVPFSITNYHIDKGHEKGVTAEMMREFEKQLNKGIKKETERSA
jgi:membrane-bound lytic murein transglycosylase MltF